MKHAFIVVALLFLVAPGSALGDVDAPCDQLLSQIDIKMRDFSNLNRLLKAFVTDSATPRKLKSVVRKSFAEDDIDIVLLTDELRQTHRLPKDSSGLATKQDFSFRYHTRASLKSKNQQNSDLVNGDIEDPRKIYPLRAANTIFVQDRSPAAEHNDLGVMIHELAHVRMRKFMEKNIAKMAGRFPDFIWLAEDGVYEIDEHFMNYIDERFAHEVEIETLRFAHGKYFVEWPSKWEVVPHDMPINILNQFISFNVVHSYEIYDENLKSLDPKNVAKFLIGGLANKPDTAIEPTNP